MKANVPVPNFQYFQLPNLSSNPAVSSAAEKIPNSAHLEQDQISLHPLELIPEQVGDLDNLKSFNLPSCQVVIELNEDSDRQQKISELFGQSLVSSSHQNKKKTTAENNISENGSSPP